LRLSNDTVITANETIIPNELNISTTSETEVAPEDADKSVEEDTDLTLNEDSLKNDK